MVEGRAFRGFWQRNVEESVRQENVRPFVEEAVLQVSNWGFSLGDLNGSSKYKGKGVLAWLKSLYTPAEKRLSGFLGPIHLWQVCSSHVFDKSRVKIHRLLSQNAITLILDCLLA